MDSPHIPFAFMGLAAFVFLLIVSFLANTHEKTRNESSHLEFRQDFADRHGWGHWETRQQHPILLATTKWITRAAALAAFAFTCWHTVNAILQD
jgi:hypothetical protein